MKKSQSIFLLSGLVPLVAAPIVIVASCSNDTTTPTDSKYTVAFNANKSFPFGDSAKPSNDSTFNEQWVKNKVIEKKAEIFTATSGTLPADNTFWQNNVTVESLVPANQTLKFTLKLTNASTVDGATAQQKTISAEITFTGFKADTPLGTETTINQTLSTVTIGLNGNKDEIESEVNRGWILSRVNLIFVKGADLIKTETDIVDQSISWEEITGGTQQQIKTSKILKFQIGAGKWYESNGSLGQQNKEFSFTIVGISSTPTLNTPLKSKSGAKVNVDVLDPQNLGKLTYANAKANATNLFDDTFVFNFRKNLLTGDFSKIKSAADLVKNGSVTTTFDDGAKAITIAFTIPKDKVNPVQPNDIQITIRIEGFK